MNSQTRRILFQGPAGSIEAQVDEPTPSGDGSLKGVAVIAHPHPLFGGTMDNKVVQTLARAYVQCGWRAVRFNFRGVGASEGVHDQGRGELQDLLALIAHVNAADGGAPGAPGAPRVALSLAGFSFGAFVVSHALTALGADSALRHVVLVGTAVTRFDVAPVPAALHANTLVVHGELDDTVPLSDVLHWARPQSLPVTVVPGATHFFHGQLPLLRNIVVRHLNTQPPHSI